MRNKANFRKSQIVYNRSFDNELQRKSSCGHLVKTNPNKANLVPSAVEGSIKTTIRLRRAFGFADFPFDSVVLIYYFYAQ
jgi:hypothetical protein